MRINLRSELWHLTLPLFFDIALVMLVGCVDTLMLSSCGDESVAAVGMVNQLMSLVFLTFQFLSTGAAILCAQFFGAKASDRFARTALLAIMLNIAIGVGASCILSLWPEDILVLMGLRSDTLPHAVIYLRITGALSFFPALSFATSAILRSSGRVVAPMAANVTANIANAAGNYILIFGHLGFTAMGVEGAAWATAISRMLALLILACCSMSALSGFGFAALKRLFPASPARAYLGDAASLVKVSIPAIGEELSYCLSQVVAIYFINRISTDALTTKTYCSNLVMFVFLFCLAATQGGDILVGHLVGRHRYRPAYLLGSFFEGRSMAVTLVCSTALAAAGPFILPLLTGNQEIVRTGTIILALDVVLEIGRVRNIFACGTLRATGDVVYPVIVGVAVQWTIGVGLACILGLPLGLGLVGVWIGFLLDENLRGIILMRRWHSQRWRDRAFV